MSRVIEPAPAPAVELTSATDFSGGNASIPTLPFAATLLASAALAACGGGGGGDAGAPSPSPAPAPAPAPAPPSGLSATDASRFLAQASIGANRAGIARVQAIGYAAWINEQIAVAPSTTRWDALVAGGFAAPTFKNGEGGFDACAWRKMLSSPDSLRQRMTLALSEIMVTSIDSLNGGWKAFAAANYLDVLEANAFGNYRALMQAISTNTAMGMYLTFRGSMKANPSSGSLPDENYARELMQLFTIGLVQLNLDGTPALTNGNPTYTYSLTDITGLARIFTGYEFDAFGTTPDTSPDFLRRPLTQIAARHETGASTFLGVTVPANSGAATALGIALDTIFAHPNVGPFVSKQLIQRLVTSNPSPAYVARIATVFNNDGSGTKGNLTAVLKAILLDDEARSPSIATGVSAGKLREPMLRFAAWARAWSAASASDAWAIGNTSEPATRLGQSPLRSTSVFNFFRPGYVPPNSAIASASLVAPEFQLTNESTVVGAVNFMQRAMSGQGLGDVVADYSSLLAIADDSTALMAEINLVLAAGQIGTATAATIASAVGTMPGGTDALRRNRIYATLTLVVAAPEFVVLK